MAQWTGRVSASSDDGYFAGEWFYNSSSNNVGLFLADVYAAWRWDNVTIPQGATITSAYLTLVAYDNDTDAIQRKIYGFDEDDTATLTSAPGGRTKTTAAVDWDINGQTANQTQTSGDIKSIIQEIVNRAGWASGNALGMITVDDGSTTFKALQHYAYDGDSTKAAYLEINYSGASPSASVSLSPSASPSPSSSQSPSSSISLSPSSSQSPSSSPSSSFSASPSPGPVGIQVSKYGYDVLSDTDPEHMIFTSGKGTLGYRERVTISGTTDANGEISATYAHNLGYVPLAFGFVTNYASQRIAVPNQWQSDWPVDEVLEENFHFYVDDTYIYVTAYAHHYEPIMGGTDTALASQDYDFDIIIYFNELSDEH